MNRISFLNRGYAFKGLLAVRNGLSDVAILQYDSYREIYGETEPF